MTFAIIDEKTGVGVLDDFRDHGALKNWVGGRQLEAETGRYETVYCPYNGAELGQAPLSAAADLDRAVETAAAAFTDWSRTNVKQRVQVMYRLKALLEENLDELSRGAALECGKTVAEAKAEVLKGIEVVEFACSLPNLVTGRILEVGGGIDCSVTREPLGVVASITPFNFPVMVPLWTLPISITLGNTVIHKPSEQVPLSPLKLAALFAEAGLPDGVYNVVHGAREAVEAICDHPRIRAVSFVGSSAVAKAVYERSARAGKRVLALGGAKNHLVVLPDAEPEATARAVVDAATGCAGQRCMAASVVVVVEGSEPFVDAMAEYARTLGMPDDMGAIINRGSVERIRRAIDEAEAERAEPLVDGREVDVPEELGAGYWVGPTLLDGVRPEMPAARDEIFGPVLSIVRVKDLDEAIAIENASPYGNAASLFTGSGEAARRFARRASAGMVGVNVGIPVPREPFAFGGWNQSRFGVGDITGESSVGFWTQDKKVTVRW